MVNSVRSALGVIVSRPFRQFAEHLSPLLHVRVQQTPPVSQTLL
jgi:hypothetical protein